jgi:hypothetical protein
MKHDDSHPSDQQLLLEIEGELSARDRKVVRAHLDACWNCRARRQEFEHAIAGFVGFHHREFDAKFPSGTGPRALLKAQLGQLSATGPNGHSRWFSVVSRFGWAAALCLLMALSLLLARLSLGRRSQLLSQAVVVSLPDSTITPGATLLVSRPAVCAQENIKNKPVPAVLQRRVFEEYGIAGADPRAYEVDYLITPALGGADDIRNLWPHSYSATLWNAQVKDALEDHLRQMVCDGQLDLATAQREIAVNWIEAYKKYFHTDRPLGRFP